MKVIDIIFALICGKVLGWVVFDFLRDYGVDIGFYKWLLLIFLPIISLIYLWLAYLIGKKILFVFQAAKFFLVGALAIIIDLKFFELFLWLFLKSSIVVSPLVPKGISFLIATFIKYWGEKHLTFQKTEKEGIKKEIAQFFAITLMGLIIDMTAFYYFTKIIGPQFEIPSALWVKLSVLFAAPFAALWNFSGYKFIVFKK